MRVIVVSVVLLFMAACGGSGESGETIEEVVAGISAHRADYPHGTTVFFSSHKSKGPILRKSWELVRAPESSAGVHRNQYAGLSTYHYLELDVPGAYTMKLTVFDGNGNSDSDEYTFHAYNLDPVPLVDWHSPRLTDVPVRLDASGSTDGNGDPLTYQWELLAAPEGAEVVLEDTDSEFLTFITDIPGNYQFGLTVNDIWDGEAIYATGHIDVIENLPPRVLLRQLPAFLDDEPVILDASPSFDFAGQSLTFEWEIVNSPVGSSPGLNVDHDTAEFTPDGPGDYEVALAASDGVYMSERSFRIVTVEKFLDLPEEVIAAEYDAVNDRLILASATPSSLLFIDPENSADVQRMTLPVVPDDFALSPDGLQAVVVHGTRLSLIDLGTEMVIDTFQTSLAEIGSVVHGGNGYIYAFPPESELAEVRNIDISTGNETLSTGLTYGSDFTRMQPGQEIIYASGKRYDASSGVAELQETGFHWCGYFWFLEDAIHLATQCGKILKSSMDLSEIPDVVGELEENENHRHFGPHTERQTLISADHMTSYGVIGALEGALAEGSGITDTAVINHTVRMYDDTTYALDHEFGVPVFREGGDEGILEPLFLYFQRSSGKPMLVARVAGSDSVKTIIVAY